jgi:hypothetical protein
MEKRRKIEKFRNRSAYALCNSGVTGESESEDDDHVFKKFTLAAYTLEKANDWAEEISMRLKQLKQFLEGFLAWYSNPLRINLIVRMDQKIPHSWPFTP